MANASQGKKICPTFQTTQKTKKYGIEIRKKFWKFFIIGATSLSIMAFSIPDTSYNINVLNVLIGVAMLTVLAPLLSLSILPKVVSFVYY